MPDPEPAVIDAVMQAYADCGIRATVALDQPELPEVAKLPFLEQFAPADLLAALRKPAPTGPDGLLEIRTGAVQIRAH